MIYSFATTEDEEQQIHRLNYATFAAELKQYRSNNDGILIDRFHKQNKYYICKKGQEVIAMIALRDMRPFSLDQKITDLDQYLPEYNKIIELRLLAIKPEFRYGTILLRLMQGAIKYCIEHDYDLAIMSGILGQAALYRKLGFVTFYKQLPSGEAIYLPMYISKQSCDRVLRYCHNKHSYNCNRS